MVDEKYRNIGIGNELLNKIKGFKKFLIAVEKDKLEALVDENPYYFYDILPYAYVLGITNKYIKKFISRCFYSSRTSESI